MREHPNAAIVRRAYDAFSRGECDAASAVATPAVYGDLVAALHCEGEADAFDARTIVPLAVAAAGDLVVAIDHLCARRGGRPLDVEGIVVFAVIDQRIVGVRRLPQTAMAARTSSSASSPPSP